MRRRSASSTGPIAAAISTYGRRQPCAWCSVRQVGGSARRVPASRTAAPGSPHRAALRTRQSPRAARKKRRLKRQIADQRLGIHLQDARPWIQGGPLHHPRPEINDWFRVRPEVRSTGQESGRALERIHPMPGRPRSGDCPRGSDRRPVRAGWDLQLQDHRAARALPSQSLSRVKAAPRISIVSSASVTSCGKADPLDRSFPIMISLRRTVRARFHLEPKPGQGGCR